MQSKRQPMGQSLHTRHYVLLRLTTDAVFIAVYVVLSSFLSVSLPIAQFSLSSLPLLLCAFAFGIPDAVTVALCGSFLEQVLYGLSPTAPLWMIAPVAMALTAGGLAHLFRHLSCSEPRIWQTVVTVVVAEFVMTMVNTGMLYLDAHIMQYTVKAFWIALPLRLWNGAARTVCTVLLTVSILKPLRLVVGRNRPAGGAERREVV